MAKIHNITLAVLILIPFLTTAEASTLYFSPSTGEYTVGAKFSVSVKVASPERAINSASGTVSFSQNNLKVVSLLKKESIFTFWASEPAFSNRRGTVKFEGGLLNPGFTGSDGKLITINFMVKKAGIARIKLPNGLVLANDGIGTNTLENSEKAEFKLTTGAPVSGLFSDTKGHWAELQIAAMAKLGIINGRLDGKFYPDKNITRAEAAILLCRIIKKEVIAVVKPFADVETDTWYADCIAALKVADIIKGYPDGTYQPNVLIRRDDFIALENKAYEKIFANTAPGIIPNTMLDDLKNLLQISVFDSGQKSYPGDGSDKNITRAEASVILFEKFEPIFLPPDTPRFR